MGPSDLGVAAAAAAASIAIAVAKVVANSIPLKSEEPKRFRCP